MDLRQLEFLVAVVDEGGFRPAARRLKVAQPPVSMALRQLERELGLSLLSRSTRGVVATAAGHEFVSYAREVLDHMEAGRRSMENYKRPGLRKVRLGVVDRPPAAELTRPVLRAIRRSGIAVDIIELAFGSQLEPLLRGDVEVAIVRPPLHHNDIEVVPIIEEPRCLVVGPDHELANEVSLSVKDSLNYPMLALCAPQEWASFWHLDDVRGRSLVSKEVAPASTVKAAQEALATSNTTVTMSLSTMRITKLPSVRWTTPEEASSLRSITLEDATPSVTALARRRGDRRPEVRAVVDAVSEAVASKIHLLPGGRVPR
jgi:DNA-binding transcriptional LysR family regulator